MDRIIAVTNQKGGVGKTTTSVNLASSLGHIGKRVLLVDMDPQGNATSGVGLDKRALKSSIYNILVDGIDINQAVSRTEYKNLDIIGSSIAFAGAELELAELENRESIFQRSLIPLKDAYDYIIIDSPPSLGLITTNALCASDGIIVPLQCEFYALEGLSQLMNTVRTVKRKYNKNLELNGVVFTMYDGRLKLSLQVEEEIRKFFKDKVYETHIPRTVRLSEAPSFGKPVLYFDKNCKGSKSYLELAREVVKRGEKACQERQAVLERV